MADDRAEEGRLAEKAGSTQTGKTPDLTLYSQRVKHLINVRQSLIISTHYSPVEHYQS